MLFQINNGYKCQKESLGSNKKRFSFIVYPQWCPFHRHCYHKNTQYIQVTKVHLNKKCCTHQSLIKTWNLFTFFLLSEWRKRDNEFEGIKQVGCIETKHICKAFESNFRHQKKLNNAVLQAWASKHSMNQTIYFRVYSRGYFSFHRGATFIFF